MKISAVFKNINTRVFKEAYLVFEIKNLVELFFSEYLKKFNAEFDLLEYQINLKNDFKLYIKTPNSTFSNWLKVYKLDLKNYLEKTLVEKNLIDLDKEIKIFLVNG